jgi:O-antigen/teichoic acid export membrane protein
VSLEKVRAAHAVLFFTALALLTRWTQLDVPLYLAFHFVATIALMAALMFVLRRTNALAGQSLRPGRLALRQNLREVFHYSHPLFIYTLTGMTTVYADRWVLQKVGGSIEQGLFSLSFNIGLAFHVFINALQPLVMREFAVAFAEGDMNRARDIFKTLIPASYILSAFFLCYAAVYAGGFVRIIGGASFQGAAAAFAIMAFLPVIHNYSILSGSVLYAANETRLLRNIGLVLMPLSIGATFLLIGPKEYGGMNLGSVGLAVKLVAMEFIGNNIVLYFNAKILNLRFYRYLLHQVSVVAVLTATAAMSKAAATFVLGGSADGWLSNMAAGGIIYVAVCLCIFHFVPSIVGIDKERALAFLKEAFAKAKISWMRDAPEP